DGARERGELPALAESADDGFVEHLQRFEKPPQLQRRGAQPIEQREQLLVGQPSFGRHQQAIESTADLARQRDVRELEDALEDRRLTEVAQSLRDLIDALAERVAEVAGAHAIEELPGVSPNGLDGLLHALEPARDADAFGVDAPREVGRRVEAGSPDAPQDDA